MWTLLILLLLGITLLFSVQSWRLKWISDPALQFFRKALPPLSRTEQEAIDAGDVWWEGDLFRGQPDWNKLHGLPYNKLTEEEQSFIDHQVMTLLHMLDEYNMSQDLKDLSKPVWDYIKKEGFFALIIPKEYGGRDFSSYANSTIVSMIASRSVGAAVTVMVPNSLGPGELLSHYGTQEQRDYWLPALAKGEEIPCFALTGPEAGSDAGSIPDQGIVCFAKFKNKKTLGIKLTWEKRYITLAPIATVLGLAFKLKDPDNLLEKGVVDLGITCALVPVSHDGVEIGRRHNPLNVPFLNGTTSGQDVFIPMDWLIGGVEYAGKGWGMLMECLSSGRGISLPALASATGHLATRTTTAYASVRKQFGLPIFQFEGIQAPLAQIIGHTYQLEASRRLTATGVDMKLRPAIVSAIAKYHMTEMGRQVINDAMDIHAGKAIQMGRKNYLAQSYMGVPITVTVEGANILTRSLMIFGQGAFRCHPYVLDEMQAAAEENEEKALFDFDRLLMSHIRYACMNAFRSFSAALTSSFCILSARPGALSRYYQHLTRFSSVLAFLTDLSMLMYRGELKRKEMFSARLGDVLSHLYLASATLKMYEDDGLQHTDLPIVHYVLQQRLHDMAIAVEGVLQNFPNRYFGLLCRLVIFPIGNYFSNPSDTLKQEVAASMMKSESLRERLSMLCPVLENDEQGIAEVEKAFLAIRDVADIDKKLQSARKQGMIDKKLSAQEQAQQAISKEVLTESEGAKLMEALKLCRIAIDVDDFDKL